MQTLCPGCGDNTVHKESAVRDHIELLDGSKYYADVPLHRCTECGFAYTDHRGELIREALQMAFDPAYNKAVYKIVKEKK